MNGIKNLTNFIKKMWRGEAILENKIKFKLICYLLGIVHIVIAIYFRSCGSFGLFMYNLVSAVFYLIFVDPLLRREEYSSLFNMAYVEIIFHACLATLLCGWEHGFMMYCIALSPVAFFITYSLPGAKRSMSKPITYSLVTMVIFVTVRRVSVIYGALVSLKSITPGKLSFMYEFNCILTYLALVLFSTLFASEIRQKEVILEKKNEDLSNISSIDPLTKLLNRRSMEKHLNEAVAEVKAHGTLFTLAIGDIDNFKMVNDVHGHNVGDDVLVMVSKAITNALPPEATLCRWGGEEFLILLPMPEVDAIPIIENVRNAISMGQVPVEKTEGNIMLNVTMTLGMSQYIHGFSIEKVISVADNHLYIGKSNGKNRVVHSKSEHNV